MASLDHMLSAGSHLGPYEIQSLVGTGGMGQVYRAIDTRLGRTVAIKQLTAQHDERFVHEARAIASLNHPHIWGQIDDAIRSLEEAHRLGPWSAMATGLLAAAHARNGHRPRADALIQEMGDDPNPVWGRVWYHLNVGELDAAAGWFATMIARRDPFALAYANAPVTQPLHRHSRWPELARLMRLPRTVTSDGDRR